MHFTTNLASLHHLIMQYQTGTYTLLLSPSLNALIGERRFLRYPSLEAAGRSEVIYCLDNVRREVQNNILLPEESLWEDAVAAVNCVASLVLFFVLLIVFHFEHLNLVGLVGDTRGSLWLCLWCGGRTTGIHIQQHTRFRAAYYGSA